MKNPNQVHRTMNIVLKKPIVSISIPIKKPRKAPKVLFLLALIYSIISTNNSFINL